MYWFKYCWCAALLYITAGVSLSVVIRERARQRGSWRAKVSHTVVVVASVVHIVVVVPACVAEGT